MAGHCKNCASKEDKQKEVLSRQWQTLENEINDIKKTGCGRMARVFKLKQKIVGNKKAGQKPTAISDPETDELIVFNTQIRRTTLKYCVKNLSNNKLSKNVENIYKLKEALHDMRMLENTKDEFDIEEDEYKNVVEAF